MNHIVPSKTNYLVFAALIVLTIATTEVARVDLGDFSIVVALLIAGVKALLVALFFMHLKWSTSRMRVVAGSGLLWLAILIGGVMMDYVTRSWTPVPGPWPPPAAQPGFSRQYDQP